MTPDQMLAITKLMNNHTIIDIGEDDSGMTGFTKGMITVKLESGNAMVLGNGSSVLFDKVGTWQKTLLLKDL